MRSMQLPYNPAKADSLLQASGDTSCALCSRLQPSKGCQPSASFNEVELAEALIVLRVGHRA